MQLKVNKRYRRTGTTDGFATKTGDIVKITDIIIHKIAFERIGRGYEGFALSDKTFKLEFTQHKKLSFKGIL